jgi:hypothetical protein
MATYNDETVNVDMDVNICNYKQAVDACRRWEKSSVCLAQYYDRVLGVMTDEERNTKGGYMRFVCHDNAYIFGRLYNLPLLLKFVGDIINFPIIT